MRTPLSCVPSSLGSGGRFLLRLSLLSRGRKVWPCSGPTILRGGGRWSLGGVGGGGIVGSGGDAVLPFFSFSVDETPRYEPPSLRLFSDASSTTGKMGSCWRDSRLSGDVDVVRTRSGTSDSLAPLCSVRRASFDAFSIVTCTTLGEALSTGGAGGKWSGMGGTP